MTAKGRFTKRRTQPVRPTASSSKIFSTSRATRIASATATKLSLPCRVAAGPSVVSGRLPGQGEFAHIVLGQAATQLHPMVRSVCFSAVGSAIVWTDVGVVAGTIVTMTGCLQIFFINPLDAF